MSKHTHTDSVFRFRLSPKTPPVDVKNLYTSIIQHICATTQLFQDGKLISPDSFAFLSDCNTPDLPAEHDDRVALFKVDAASSGSDKSTKEEARARGSQELEREFYDHRVLQRTEPRLTFLIDIMSEIASHFSFETDETGELRAATLRSPEVWATPSTGDPYEVLGSLSRSCNARCEFCYVFGNPTSGSVQLNRFTDNLSRMEAEQRLALFKEGKCFPLPTYDLEEITIHPSFNDLLPQIRGATQSAISLTTNGYSLDEETVAFLATHKPVHVTLSLNAVRSATRKRLMGGRHWVGKSSLELLARYNVPTTASVVPWPSLSMEELEDTIRFVDAYHCNSINFILPGYTRLNSIASEFDALEHQIRIIDRIRTLRADVKTPLVVQPRFLEDTIFAKSSGAALVIGVTPRSSAALSGVEIGDCIEAVDGEPVVTRTQCWSMLAHARECGARHSLTIRRRGESIIIPLSDPSSDYIYGAPLNDRFGIHLIAGSIPIAAVRRVFEILRLPEITQAAIVTSKIMEPHIISMLSEHQRLLGDKAVSVDTIVPKNDFFGGNIIMGDMLTVGDIKRGCEAYCHDHDLSPDVVIVPTSSFHFGGWFRDLEGNSASELHHLRWPVRFVACAPFE